MEKDRLKEVLSEIRERKELLEEQALKLSELNMSFANNKMQLRKLGKELKTLEDEQV